MELRYRERKVSVREEEGEEGEERDTGGKETDRQVDRQTDRQEGRQIDIHSFYPLSYTTNADRLTCFNSFCIIF